MDNISNLGIHVPARAPWGGGCSMSGFQAQTGGIYLAPENSQIFAQTTRHMDGRLCDTSTISRKKPKTSHIGRHFIKAPQTMVWSDSQYCAWINSAGLGLDPQPKTHSDWTAAAADELEKKFPRPERSFELSPETLKALRTAAH